MTPVDSRAPDDARRVGLAAMMASASMLFLAVGSAFVARRGFPLFGPPDPPLLLGPALGLAVASSVLYETAARARAAAAPALAASFVALAGYMTLSVWMASRALAAPDPRSGFLALFLGLHVLHASGGLIAFPRAVREGASSAFARLLGLFLHFLTAVFVFIWALLALF
jgi:hypothetical protein